MNQFGIMVGLEKKAAFEGWFSKVDDQKNDLMFSVIWGYTTHKETSHAFLQFTSSLDQKTSYIWFPIEELSYEKDPFVLHIGKNRLTEKGMVLDFLMDGIPVKGEFLFSDLTPIRKSFFRPGIMGWLTLFPNECNHSITSMDHAVNGVLHIGERTWFVDQASGYVEKDWGTGFPREYVWVQANDWKESSVVFSYATVPVLGQHARGFFLVLHHEGKEYRFSSIEGSRMLHFKVRGDSFVAILGKGKHRVVIKAKQAHPVALVSPDHGEMKAKIKESLDGRVEVLLQKGKKNLVHLETDRASIDVHYDQL
ncbi:tocopherol cyclase family protein [Proteiniclasticum sp. C24MP]|uniref:tocopherol cyclase family protein n=1 Tax=Proteiniclasticum sp. C24MP TaxID=3374101 RepID=UPI0037545960